MELSHNSHSEPHRGTQELFLDEIHVPIGSVHEMVIRGLKKAAKQGSVRSDQAQEYIEAYKNGLAGKPVN